MTLTANLTFDFQSLIMRTSIYYVVLIYFVLKFGQHTFITKCDLQNQQDRNAYMYLVHGEYADLIQDYGVPFKFGQNLSRQSNCIHNMDRHLQ